MPISVVFDPPLPSDSPSTFNTKAFTLLGDLNDWSTQANALPGEVATNLSALLASPPAIGGTTPAAGSFTTVTSDSVTMKPTGSTAKGWLLPEKNWLGSGVSESMALVSMTNIPVYTGGSTSKTAEFSASGLAVTGALSATKSGAGYEPAMFTLATPSETGSVYRIGMASGGSLTIGRSDTATTNVTLDSSGNLGLGVTPSTSDYSGAATILNVKGNSSGKIGAVKVQSFGTANATGIELFAADGLNEAGLLIKGAATSMVFFTGSTPTKRATLDASGNLGLGVAPSAGINACLQIKDGIKFPATQVPSADDNTLDDYEEGTFTPIQGAGLTVVGTFSSSGRYTKVGRVVTIEALVLGSTSVACSAAGIAFTGLPFVSSFNGMGSAVSSAITSSSMASVYGSSMYLVESIPASTGIYFTITYSV